MECTFHRPAHLQRCIARVHVMDLIDDDWIDAAEAREILREWTGQNLQRQILERARDGIIRARAKHYVEVAPSSNRIGGPSGPNKETRYTDHEIPREFFWAASGAALEGNWTTGDFSTWISGKWHCRAFGVQFLKSEIEAMLPADLPAPLCSSASQLQKQHSEGERREWIAKQPQMDGDLAYKVYQAHERYLPLKQEEFRELWRTLRNTKPGRPRKEPVTR